MAWKALVRSVIFCLSFILAGSLSSADEGAKHFLWKARSKTATVYLFGSVHVATPQFYPLPPIVEESFASAGVLAVEVDPAGATDPALMQRMLLRATYTGNDTIRNHLSSKNLEMVSREMARAGLSLEQFARFKPWFLAMTLELTELGKLGYDPRYGLDRYFAEKARGTKRLVELESFDYQLKLMDGFSDREQELFLLSTIKDLARLDTGISDLMNAWRTGDAKAMEEIVMKTLKESPETTPIYEKMYAARNREMSDKVEQLLRSRGTSFVVVGAAHLVGKGGIVTILRERGYTVEQR